MLNLTSLCVVTACSADLENGQSWNLELPRRERFVLSFLPVSNDRESNLSSAAFQVLPVMVPLVNEWEFTFSLSSFFLGIFCLFSKLSTLISQESWVPLVNQKGRTWGYPRLVLTLMEEGEIEEVDAVDFSVAWKELGHYRHPLSVLCKGKSFSISCHHINPKFFKPIPVF